MARTVASTRRLAIAVSIMAAPFISIVFLCGGAITIIEARRLLGYPPLADVSKKDEPTAPAPAKAPATPTTRYTPRPDYAWTMAQMFVKDALVSPRSASFGNFWEGEVQDPRDCVTHLGGGVYRVRGWVDSENAFGVVRRTHFTLKVRDSKDNNHWTLEGPILGLQK